jgi:hypothetical protein
MIIATFNVENLFERPRAMNLPSWREGQPALDAAAECNALFSRRVYSSVDRRKILHRLRKFGLLGARSNNPFLTRRTIRGKLLERKRDQPPRIVATGRDDWVGWLELKKEPISGKRSLFRRLGWCGTAMRALGKRRTETLGDGRRRGAWRWRGSGKPPPSR